MDKADGGSLKEDALALSRLRAAWAFSRAEFNQARARVTAEQLEVDWGAPLGAEDERAQEFGDACDGFSPASEHARAAAGSPGSPRIQVRRPARQSDRHAPDPIRVPAQAPATLYIHSAWRLHHPGHPGWRAASAGA